MTDETNLLDDSEYIIIPNPIYDVVFRYLMEDPESAMIVLSTLIDEKILTLKLKTPKQNRSLNPIQLKISSSVDNPRLFQIDFEASVRWPNGEEEVIGIEVFKSTQSDDIHKFEWFLNKYHRDKSQQASLYPQKKSQRVIKVFLLSFIIETEINDLVIKPNGLKTGVFRNSQLAASNRFIEKMDSDFVVVQLPNISRIEAIDYENDNYKKELFALLTLFDQKLKLRKDGHRLMIAGLHIPESILPVVRRLQWALADFYGIDEHIYAEEERLAHIMHQENQIAYYLNKLYFLEKPNQSLNTKTQTETNLKA